MAQVLRSGQSKPGGGGVDVPRVARLSFVDILTWIVASNFTMDNGLGYSRVGFSNGVWGVSQASSMVCLAAKTGLDSGTVQGIMIQQCKR